MYQSPKFSALVWNSGELQWLPHINMFTAGRQNKGIPLIDNKFHTAGSYHRFCTDTLCHSFFIFHSLHLSSRSPTASFSILRPAALLSLSLNDLIPPMPLHLSPLVWLNFTVEVTHRVRMWQHWFLLVSTRLSLLRRYVTEGNWLLSEYVIQGKNNSRPSGFHDAFVIWLKSLWKAP